MPTRATHVLSVSYDLPLLTTRRLLLEHASYKVTSAESFKEAVAKCKKGTYNLFILGHSIPTGDKKELIKNFRASCPAPVLSLKRRGEEDVSDADYRALPDRPDELMQLVASILRASDANETSIK